MNNIVNVEIVDFPSELRTIVKGASLCVKNFGSASLAAVEFCTTIGTYTIPADFYLVRSLCKRVSAPYECYTVERKKLDIESLKVKIIQRKDGTLHRITL